MKKLIALSLVLAIMAACTTVPITGRRQMNLLPESQMMGMAVTSYSQFVTTNPMVPVTDARAQQVKEIGEKMAAAATRYLKIKGASDRVAHVLYCLLGLDILLGWFPDTYKVRTGVIERHF